MNIKKIKEILKHPSEIPMKINYRYPKILKCMDDETCLKFWYRICIGKKLNLDNPQTFNEKLQWLKLHDRNPIYTNMVDKYEAKKYVADRIGEQYIIPTLGVWDKFDDINFECLPNQFVLKCTHDSGGLVICRDKNDLNINAARKRINRCLKRNFYWVGREWPYKDIKPRIIAEEYLNDENRIVPEDYKVYCTNGKVQYIVIFHNRFSADAKLSESVYTSSWEKLNVSLDNHFEISKFETPKPECLEELLSICVRLAADIPQIRIDFYIIQNKLYFGELTLFTASGLQPMIPAEYDIAFGNKLSLAKLNNSN